MIVTHAHLLSIYCNKGARPFFKLHGLDWSTFVREGLPEEQFIQTGDALALRLVEEARRQWAEKTRK